MFVRKKKNRSGSVSVVVVSKPGGKFREVHKIGVSSDMDEIERLYHQGLRWIREQSDSLDLFEHYSQEQL